MRKIIWALALIAPLVGQAAPPAPGHGPGEGPGWEARHDQVRKRARLARTLGLAEALDLSEAEALKMRDLLSRFDERRQPIHRQFHDAMAQVRKAARGDAAAQKSVDDALRRLREARGQLQALDDEMFQALSKDLTPERKARAALFLTRFRQRMETKMRHLRETMDHMREGRPPGGAGARMGALDGGPGDGPIVEILSDDETM